MTEKEEKILKKIKKLLNLSKKNNNKEEAESAALKAQQLMKQYKIKYSKTTAQDEEIVVKEEITVGIGKKWKYALAVTISENFCCKVYTRGSKVICFFGEKLDVEICKNVFLYLFKFGDKAAKREVRTFKNKGYNIKGVYNLFIFGFLSGIEKKLNEQCRALVLVTPQHVENKFLEISKNMGNQSSNLSVKVSEPELYIAYENGEITGYKVMDKNKILLN